MDRNQRIKEFLKKPVRQKNPVILGYCKDKKVLDIGCIGQDNNPEKPGWLHGKIALVAKELAGVDTNEKMVMNMKERGFNMFPAGSFNNKDYPEPDVIVMADVIEHVSDIISFLLFYKESAKNNTLFLISTPNPFSIRHSFSILLFGRSGINPEHTVAIDPSNMLEILERAGLEIVDFTWLHEYSKPVKLYNKVLYRIYRLLYSWRKFWAPNYLVVVKLQVS